MLTGSHWPLKASFKEDSARKQERWSNGIKTGEGYIQNPKS